MFRPDGSWKEFGIGQQPEKYTPFPFWMFCLVWAIVAYTLTLLLMPFLVEPDDSIPEMNVPRNVPRLSGNNKRRTPRNLAALPEIDMEETVEEAVQLPKGYYVLNKKATELSGVPKYVYLGENEPN
jgi:hypothetical protein